MFNKYLEYRFYWEIYRKFLYRQQFESSINFPYTHKDFEVYFNELWS